MNKQHLDSHTIQCLFLLYLSGIPETELLLLRRSANSTIRLQSSTTTMHRVISLTTPIFLHSCQTSLPLSRHSLIKESLWLIHWTYMPTSEVCYLYSQGDLMTMICEQSVIDITRPVRSHLKAALPTAYGGTSSKACTFLMECRTFMQLNRSAFPDNQVKILWALQLCSDKAANWK